MKQSVFGTLGNNKFFNNVFFLYSRHTSRQRCNSLGSALLRGRTGLGLALPYRPLSDNGEPLSDTNSEELQAYVSEVTRELATEIKSELREVISKVLE